VNQTASQSVVDLLLASGVPSREEALQLAQNMNGGSWTAQVLDSGKVDEQRFLSVIGNFFRVTLGHRLGRKQNSTMIITQFNSSEIRIIQCLKERINRKLKDRVR